MDERYYVYAIATPDMHLPKHVSGFGGPLCLLPHGDLGAVVSRVSAAELERIASASKIESLVRHENVVEAVCASGRALPVRFGTALPNGSAVSQALAARYQSLRDDLWRLGDKIELGVMILWQPADVSYAAPPTGPDADRRSALDADSTAARPGAAYMQARQTLYRRAASARERAQALAHELDAALRPHVIAFRRSVCPSERLALRDVYLLERERTDVVESALDEVRQRHQEARFLVSGPWPPYSFVTPPAHTDTEALQGHHERAEPDHWITAQVQ